METFTIGEAAAQTGFTTSSLRYYDKVGLVTPPARSASGYRMYDTASIERLEFVGRAKQLGCTLDEIADLVDVRDGDDCGPVQRRLHDLVTDKLRRARAQMADLDALADQLRSAAAQLGTEPVDGPCGPDCACSAGLVDRERVAVALVDKATQSAPADIVCTLDAAAVPERLDDWQVLLDAATERRRLGGAALRVEFANGVDLNELARLVAAEHGCCGFFGFAITVDERGVGLEVTTQPEGEAVLLALFGDSG